MLNKWKPCLASALTTVLLTDCASSPTTESAGEYLDDAATTTKVKSALIRDKDVMVSDIRVETFKGAVQHSGLTTGRTEIDRPVQIAGRVPGVKSVHNDLYLKSFSVINRRGEQSPETNQGPGSRKESLVRRSPTITQAEHRDC